MRHFTVNVNSIKIERLSRLYTPLLHYGSESSAHATLYLCVFFSVCDRSWKWFSIESIVNCNCIYHDLSIMFHFNEFRSLKYEKIAAATQNMDKKEQHRTAQKERKRRRIVYAVLCVNRFVWWILETRFLSQCLCTRIEVSQGLTVHRSISYTVPSHTNTLSHIRKETLTLLHYHFCTYTHSQWPLW